MSVRPILYAEDEENDTFLLRRAFAKAGIPNPLEIAADGVQAIEHLAGVGSPGERLAPCLIFLDLKMPFKNGFEVLQWIRQQPAVRTIPVIIFTSSTQERDVHDAYALGANAYLVKPPGPDQFTQIAEVIRTFWLFLNVNPPDPSRFPAEL